MRRSTTPIEARSNRDGLVLILTSFLVALAAQATDPTAVPEAARFPAPLTLTAQQDHLRMMRLLGITSIRRGRDGMNPQSPHYANYDESKANPFPDLPDPLVLKNGQKVTTPEMWWKQRRPEIVEDFDREVYGRVRDEKPDDRRLFLRGGPFSARNGGRH